MSKDARPSYPVEFKRDVVAVARAGGETNKQIAKDFGISETTLYRWIRKYDPTPEQQASGLSEQEQAELAELRKTNRRLQQENEILRRATAYFAKDAAPK